MVYNFASRFLMNKNFIIVILLLILLSFGGMVYHRISNLESKIVKLEKDNLSLKQELTINKTMLNDYRKRYKSCINSVKKKNKVLKELRNIFKYKPKPIHPTIIKKKECKLEIETKESLNEKDPIFNNFSTIGN